MRNYEDMEGVFKAYTELINIFIEGELSEQNIEIIKPYIDEIKTYNSLLTIVTAINKIDESELKSGNLDKVLIEMCSLLPLPDFSYDSVNEKAKINIDNDKTYFFDISKQQLSDGTFIISVQKSSSDANSNYIDKYEYVGVAESDLDSYIKKFCLKMCIQESVYRDKCCECLKQFRNSIAHGRVYPSNDDSKKINFRVNSKYLNNFSMNIDELQSFASNIEQIVLDNFEIERSELPCDGVKLNDFIDLLFNTNKNINTWEWNIPRLYVTLLFAYNLYISDLYEKIFSRNLAMNDSNFYLTEDLEIKNSDGLSKELKQVSEQIKTNFDIRDLILRYPSFYGENFLEILENPTLGYRDLTDESKKNLWNLFLESEYGDELRTKLRNLNLENLLQNEGTYPETEELRNIEKTLECDDLLYYMVERFPALGRIGENEPYVRNFTLFEGFEFEEGDKEFCYPSVKNMVIISKDDIKGIIFTFKNFRNLYDNVFEEVEENNTKPNLQSIQEDFEGIAKLKEKLETLENSLKNAENKSKREIFDSIGSIKNSIVSKYYEIYEKYVYLLINSNTKEKRNDLKAFRKQFEKELKQNYDTNIKYWRVIGYNNKMQRLCKLENTYIMFERYFNEPENANKSYVDMLRFLENIRNATQHSLVDVDYSELPNQTYAISRKTNIVTNADINDHNIIFEWLGLPNLPINSPLNKICFIYQDIVPDSGRTYFIYRYDPSCKNSILATYIKSLKKYLNKNKNKYNFLKLDKDEYNFLELDNNKDIKEEGRNNKNTKDVDTEYER